MNALNKLLGSLQAVQSWDGTRYAPRRGMEAEATRLRFDVDRIAGRAAYAFSEAGSFVSWKPRGTMQTQPVNPATAWATVVSDDPMFGLDVLMACCSQALGILEMKAEAAEEEERHPTPRPPASVHRHVPTWVARAAWWTVGSVGTALLVAYLTYRLGWNR